MKGLTVFDFNCDIAQDNKKNKIKDEYEIAQYVSSLNISGGLFSGNPCSVMKALKYASENERAIGVHIGYDDEKDFGYTEQNLSDDELEALILYQISAISAFAHVYGLDLEYVRFHGAMYEKFNSDIEFARKASSVVKQFCPWLTIVVGNWETKEIIERDVNIKCAYEVTFGDNSSIREIRELEHMPETIHFTSAENAKRAYDVIKPSPFSYNRVAEELPLS